MLKIRILSLLLIFFNFLIAQVNSNHVSVRGYTRSDGTYVSPHMRTAPNSTVNDNFSTVGNVNLYTGKEGWLPRDNYVSPSYSYDLIDLRIEKLKSYYIDNNTMKDLYNRKSNPDIYNSYSFEDPRFNRIDNSNLKSILEKIEFWERYGDESIVSYYKNDFEDYFKKCEENYAERIEKIETNRMNYETVAIDSLVSIDSTSNEAIAAVSISIDENLNDDYVEAEGLNANRRIKNNKELIRNVIIAIILVIFVIRFIYKN